MKQLILFLYVLGFVILGRTQNMVGNAGDIMASEFNMIARTAVHFLQKQTLSKADQQLVAKIQREIETTLVESIESELEINGRIVDAINYPLVKWIKINRKRWEQIRRQSPVEKTVIVLHEYIWIAGIDDGNYAVSTRLTKHIERDLNENSISIEKYHGALRDFHTDMLQFPHYLMEMRRGLSYMTTFCFFAGTVKVHSDKITMLFNVEDMFWLSLSQKQEVIKSIAFIQKFSAQQVEDCRNSATLEFDSQLNGQNELAKTIHRLTMITRLPLRYIPVE